MKCKTVPQRKLCTEKCERILDCGHICKNVCAKECKTKKCEERVLKKNIKVACDHNNVWILCCDKDKGIYNFFLNLFLEYII